MAFQPIPTSSRRWDDEQEFVRSFRWNPYSPFSKDVYYHHTLKGLMEFQETESRVEGTSPDPILSRTDYDNCCATGSLPLTATIHISQLSCNPQGGGSDMVMVLRHLCLLAGVRLVYRVTPTVDKYRRYLTCEVARQEAPKLLQLNKRCVCDQGGVWVPKPETHQPIQSIDHDLPTGAAVSDSDGLLSAYNAANLPGYDRNLWPKTVPHWPIKIELAQNKKN